MKELHSSTKHQDAQSKPQKPSNWLISSPSFWGGVFTAMILTLSAQESVSQALRSQAFGRALTSGQSRGYSTVQSKISPGDPALVDGEYSYYYTEIFDSRTGAFMTSGLSKICENGLCKRHPVVVYQDISGLGGQIVDKSIGWNPSFTYLMRVNYTGYGTWEASTFDRGISGNKIVLQLRNLVQNTPMNTVGSNAEAQYLSTPIGRAIFRDNSYRLGGTDQFYPFCYTKIEKQPTSVAISGCVNYEWFISYP